MRRLAIIGLSCVVCSVAWAQTNYIAVSNINRPSSTEGVFFGSENGQQKWAISFATSNTVTALSSVSLSLDGSFTEPQVNPNSALGTVQISICSDAGGLPGGSLAGLNGVSQPVVPGVYTYTNSTPLTLSTNARYWIVAASANSSGIADYFWNETTNTVTDAGSVWAVGPAAFFSSGTWSAAPAKMFPQFSVTVVPSKPVLAISEVIALTYPTTEFPYTLQQNTNLASTNWVTATNANEVFSTNTSQIEFLAPITGSPVFYRLLLQ